MKFSVLLSLYYKESPVFLRQSLDSVFCQTLLPDEVVLVEDGPLTPELDAVVDEFKQKYPILKIVPLPVNVGLGKALNEGLKHCTNELVARMDTDDVCKPDRFERQIRVFEEHPEYDVVGAWIDEFDDDIANVKSVRKVRETADDIFEFGKSRNPMNHPVVMFKKIAVEAVGGYKHFYLLEDYYLWLRMLLNGSKFYNIQDSLLWMRASKDMFKRRGGLKYAVSEVKLFNYMLSQNYIGFMSWAKNVIIRFSTRVMPNKIREYIYTKILRK